MAIQVRPRLASDTHAIRRVARAAWRAALKGRAPAGFLVAIWRTFYGRERLVLGLVEARRDAFVAERDGVVVGYADGIAGAGEDGAAGSGGTIACGRVGAAGAGGAPEPAGAYDVARVYVTPEAWGAGAGRALVDAVLAAARARGAARVDVEVDAANARGLAWWQRRGFVRTGTGTYELPPFARATVLLARSSAPLGG